MQEIRKLYEKGEYQRIIKENINSEEDEVLWLVISSLLQTKKTLEALKLIEEKQQFLLKNPKKLMTFHIELLITSGMVDQAFKTLSYYEDLPYISYEIEELLVTLKKQIFASLSPKSNEIDDERIRGHLKNLSSEEQLLHGINSLHNRDVKLFLKELQKILLSDCSEVIKTLVLLLLVDKQIMEEVEIYKNGVRYQISPYVLNPIIAQDEIAMLVNKAVNFKNISLTTAMKQLLINYAMAVYPESLFEEGDDCEITILAAEIVALELFKESGESIKTEAIKRHLDYNKILTKAELIKASAFNN